MFTKKRYKAPTLSDDWSKDGFPLIKSICDYWLSLEDKNALTIGQAQIYVDQGLQFPTTQVASSDVNNLDDYLEGTYTPSITAGAGVFTTVSATGWYTKVGDTVHWGATVTITTNGTAAGAIIVSLPTYGSAHITPTKAASVHGSEIASSFIGVQGYTTASSNTIPIRKYDGTYPGADGLVFVVGGSYK